MGRRVVPGNCTAALKEARVNGGCCTFRTCDEHPLATTQYFDVQEGGEITYIMGAGNCTDTSWGRVTALMPEGRDVSHS